MAVTWEKTVGPHKLLAETNGIYSIQFGASPSESEMREIVDSLSQAAAGKPVYLLLNLTRVETMSAPARRAVGEAAKTLNCKAVSMYGASFHMKVVGRLLNVALAMFMKSDLAQSFSDTPDEARTWLEARIKQQPAEGA